MKKIVTWWAFLQDVTFNTVSVNFTWTAGGRLITGCQKRLRQAAPRLSLLYRFNNPSNYFLCPELTIFIITTPTEIILGFSNGHLFPEDSQSDNRRRSSLVKSRRCFKLCSFRLSRPVSMFY